MTELFEQGIDYTRWCRRVLAAAGADPRARLLFESTICEPRRHLFELLGSTAINAVGERFQSVFGGGNRFLTQAVAHRYGVDVDQVLCTTGAINAITMVLRTFVQPGDHVLVERPAFDLLPYAAERAGAWVEPLQRAGDTFTLTGAGLRDALRPETRLVLISNLHNPSGVSLDGDTLEALAFEASCVGAWLVVDEVYEDFARDVYGGCAARLAANVISVNSLSKVHGLFALRCGWIVAQAGIIDRVADANARDEFGVSKLSHAVAAYLLEYGDQLDEHWRYVLEHSRPVMVAHADALTREALLTGDVPEHGCMYFPRVSGVDDTWSLAAWLWKHHRLLAAPGELFGAPGHLRLGFGGADPGKLDDGLGRLHTALKRYHRATSAG